MSELLTVSLAFAVPVWQQRIRQNYEHYELQRDRLSLSIVALGDVLQYRGEDSAKAFNDLACAIALASFQPGGIEVLGMKFEALLEPCDPDH